MEVVVFLLQRGMLLVHTHRLLPVGHAVGPAACEAEREVSSDILTHLDLDMQRVLIQSLKTQPLVQVS